MSDDFLEAAAAALADEEGQQPEPQEGGAPEPSPDPTPKDSRGFGRAKDTFLRIAELGFQAGEDSDDAQRLKALREIGLDTPEYGKILERIKHQMDQLDQAGGVARFLGKTNFSGLNGKERKAAENLKHALLQPGYFRAGAFSGSIFGEGLRHTNPDKAREQQAKFMKFVIDNGIADRDEAAVLADLVSASESNRRKAAVMFKDMDQRQVRVVSAAMQLFAGLETAEKRADRFMAIADERDAEGHAPKNAEFARRRAEEIRAEGHTARRGLARGLTDEDAVLLMDALKGKLTDEHDIADLERLLVRFEEKRERRDERAIRRSNRTLGTILGLDIGITDFMIAQRIFNAGTLGQGGNVLEQITGVDSGVSDQELAQAFDRLSGAGKFGLAFGEIGVQLVMLKGLTAAYTKALSATRFGLPATAPGLVKASAKLLPAADQAARQAWIARQFSMPLAFATMEGSHAAATGSDLKGVFTAAGEGLLVGKLAASTQERVARFLGGRLPTVLRARFADSLAETVSDVMITVGLQGIENITFEEILAGALFGAISGAIGGEQVQEARQRRRVRRLNEAVLETTANLDEVDAQRARMRKANEERLREQGKPEPEPAAPAEKPDVQSLREKAVERAKVRLENEDLTPRERNRLQERVRRAEAALAEAGGAQGGQAKEAVREAPAAPAPSVTRGDKTEKLVGPVVEEDGITYRRPARAEDKVAVPVPADQVTAASDRIGDLVPERAQAMRDFRQANPDAPIAMPEGGVDSSGRLFLDEGRHRAAQVLDEGAERVIVAMSPEDAARFQESRSRAPEPEPLDPVVVARAERLLRTGMDPDRVADALELETSTPRDVIDRAVFEATDRATAPETAAAESQAAGISGQEIIRTIAESDDPLGPGIRDAGFMVRTLRDTNDPDVVARVAEELGVDPVRGDDGTVNVSATIHDVFHSLHRHALTAERARQTRQVAEQVGDQTATRSRTRKATQANQDTMAALHEAQTFSDQDPVTARELREKHGLGLDGPASRRALDRLVKAGLVEKVPLPDEKTSGYRLTAKGQEDGFSQAVGMPAPDQPSRRQELSPEQRGSQPPVDPITGRTRYPPGDGPPKTTPDRVPDTPAASKIIAAIRTLFNIPIIVSKRLRGRGRQAELDTHARVIAIDRHNNIEGAAHDIGHVLEAKTGEALQGHPQENFIEGELVRLGRTIYQDYEPANGWRSEGWAEAVRYWLTDPEGLKVRAPQLAKFMDEHISFARKGWERSLKQIRDLAAQHFKASAQSRVRAFRSQKRVNLDSPSFAQQWIDAGHPILKQMRDLAKAGFIPDPSDPDALTDPGLVREGIDGSHNAIVTWWRDNGMTDITGAPTGPALSDAMRVVGKHRWGELVDYLTAKQGLSIKANGKEPGIALEDLVEITQKYQNDPDIQKGAQIVWDWNRGVLEYLQQAGAITADEAKAMATIYPYYVPSQRALPRHGKTGATLPKSGPKRLRTGSTAEIVNPIDAMVAQAAQFVKWAHARSIQNRLANLADAVPGMGDIISRVDPSHVELSRAIQDARDTFHEQMRQAGLDPNDLSGFNMARAFSVKGLDDGRGDIVFEAIGPDGKKAMFRVNRDFYKATLSQNFWKFGPVMDLLLAAPARVKRLGTTGLRVGFAPFNVVKDFAIGYWTSATANPVTWTYNWFAANLDIVKNALGGRASEWLRMYHALGVGMSPQVALDKMQRSGSTTRDLVRAASRAPKVAQPFIQVAGDLAHFRLFRAIGDTVNTVRDIIGITEAGPRVAAMRIQAKKLGIDPTKPITFANAMRLARAGRQVTVDFNAGGELARKWNQIIPFFNVAIQGPRRVLAAAKRRPFKSAMVMSGLISSSLSLWWTNKDKDWYKDLPWWERYGYWHFDNGVKIPKPFEIGAVLSLFEGYFDGAYAADPENFVAALASGKGFGSDQFAGAVGVAFRTTTPGNFMGFVPMPVLMEEAIAWQANRNFFLDRPIVPRAEEDRDPEAQFGPSTTRVAQFVASIPRRVGQLLGFEGEDRWRGLSPRKVDNLITGIFGGLGRDLAQLTGTVSGDPSRAQTAPGGDIPVIGSAIIGQITKRFTRSGRTSQAVNDFYERRARLKELKGDAVEAKDPRIIGASRFMDSVARRMKLLRGRRNAPGISLKERAEWLAVMRKLANQANETVNRILGAR